MSESSTTSNTNDLPTAPTPAIMPPLWVSRLVDGGLRFDATQATSPMAITCTIGDTACLVTATRPGAASLLPAEFEQETTAMYEAIREALAVGEEPAAPVRFWNYLPAIHEPTAGGLDRYMVFNAGRFAAMKAWMGGPNDLSGLLPAASAVGHFGDALVIHCLAMPRPGVMIENPRQVPAWKYSHRYGPIPPSFSRATVVAHSGGMGRALLVAGTAAIRGEQSMHADDLTQQMDETLINLRSLLIAAGAVSDDLQAFTDVRAYHIRSDDAVTIETSLRAAVGPLATIELIRSDLCRPDLLVEVEGLAILREGVDRE